MARPSRCRRICVEPAYDSFAPQGIPGGGRCNLSVDEYEVVRLIDLEKKTHEQCARLMEVSRTTVTEMYESARYKIADSIVNGKVLTIAGGHYRLCGGAAGPWCGRNCKKSGGGPSAVPAKGAQDMRIAVTYENGTIFQHFGHTQQFKLYDVDAGTITASRVVDAGGSGHGALAGFLREHQADVLICGGIGGGAQDALAQAGIRLYGGVSGGADEAVQALLAGNLDYNPQVHCTHHEQGHSCGSHACGEDRGGCTGSR